MVIKCADFKPEEFFKGVGLLKNRKGNPGGNKRHYMALTSAFDIETSYLRNIQESIMYIWQWAFGEDLVVYGRSWAELEILMCRIKKCLPEDRWLVCYIHNASFEFQYLKGVYGFMPNDIFALSSRKVLKFDMHGCFEMRCSYKLSNMSLDAFTRKFNVKHQKLSGDEFDYTKVRYPWTDLTDRELEYCTNDVQGLVEAVDAQMARDGDTLQTIPLTSTGYVRRDAKLAMRKSGNHHNSIAWMLPDYELYEALREAFRGGNTHASRFFALDTIYNVHSADRSSSYPAVMCNCEYPMSVFIRIAESDLNLDYIARCIKIRHKALLLRIKIENCELRDPYWPCPYLTKDKCRNLKLTVLETVKQGKKEKTFYHEDNGRIIKAGSLETTVTDVDLQIIMKEYKGKITILDGWYSSYKKLPQALIDLVIKYYRDKTELKGVSGQELYYDKAKALLNALYGMMAQNPVRHSPVFRQVGDWDDDDIPDVELLAKYNKTAFLCYQWGVWVTAWARKALEDGLQLVQDTHQQDPKTNFVYADTDSIKYTGSVDWTGYNNARIAECMESGSYATDRKGITHYMGVFESEDNQETGFAYAQFRTMGAKKYAYKITDDGPTHVTISGVDKRKGGAELDKYNGLESFTEDFVFVEAGGTESVYSDDPEIKKVVIDGHELEITSNVSILPSTYTLGITGEYERIIKYGKSYLDNKNYV